MENLGLAGEVAPMSPRPGIGPELETLTLLPRPARRLMFGSRWAFAGLNCPAQFRDIGNVPRIMLHPKLKQSAQIDSPDKTENGARVGNLFMR